MSRTKPHDVRALRALVREAASLEVPPLDWERLEGRLFASTETPVSVASGALETARTTNVVSIARPARIGRPTGMGALLGVALAAACTALFVASGGGDRGRGAAMQGGSEAVLRAPRPGALAADANSIAAATLRVGEVIRAGTEPLRCEHEGKVTWTLAPGASARVVALGSARDEAVTVALLSGSIHAEVVHRDQGEVFAVEADRTRVAVHGTSFTVARDGASVRVDVAHGSVAVGPAGHPGSTHGWLMVGPASAAFSLDGGRDAHWFASDAAVAMGETEAHDASADSKREEPAVDPRAASLAGPVARPKSEPPRPAVASLSASGPVGGGPESTSSPAVQGVTPEARTEADWGPVAARLVSQVTACFARQSAGAGDVAFSIDSALSFTISPEGTIPAAMFSPPLSPRLMACAEDEIRRVHVGRALRPTLVKVPVHLARPEKKDTGE